MYLRSECGPEAIGIQGIVLKRKKQFDILGSGRTITMVKDFFPFKVCVYWMYYLLLGNGRLLDF